MIVVDTNVLSEFTRANPADVVLTWLSEQNIDQLCTTAITEAEMIVGQRLLPEGHRKNQLKTAIEDVLDLLEYRILPFDSAAAREFPEVILRRRAAGLQITQADGQIAAIARAHGAKLATRNIADFKHCELQLINPWNTNP